MKQRLLIIGAGMATAYLLRELSRQRHAYDITVIGAEPDSCYNRVMLSNVLAGESAAADLAMLEETDARMVSNTRIVQLDLASQVAVDESGDGYAYDHLVLATGATVARPPLDLDGIGGVMAFRTLADTEQLRQLDASGKRAVVLGGGLLGLEAAHGLNVLGFSTAVVHRNPVLMNRQLDQSGGRYLAHQLQARGIEFHLGTSISGVQTEAGSLAGITLADGRGLDCDLLVLATGIVPNIALAESAGIATGRGVMVDALMATTTEGVYALGECSQVGEHCFGLVAPIQEQAAVLARRLCGVSGEPFAIRDWPTQLKISGIDIYRAGDLDESAEQLLLEDRSLGIYRRLVVRDDRLVGAVLVGDKRGGNWYAELIAMQRKLSGLRHGLMFGREVSEAQQLAVTAA